MRALLLLLPLVSGCGVIITGDFQGIPFAPTSSLVAVADQNDLLLRAGAVVPVLRPVGQQRLHLLLTAARVDVNEDWRRYDIDSLLELKRDLATQDALLLKDIPLDRFGADEPMEAVVEDGRQSGDFTVFAGAGLPAEAEAGLGAKLRVRIDPKGLDVQPREGSLSLSVSVQREREAGQDGDVATGEVVLEFGGGLLPERLSESNLTVAEPVVACMQAQGPSSAGLCREAEALPYVDETGVVR